ncbi:hypothetical protein EAF00_000403 [Botryotinia globosa]|nr:hypothetical protein EAF00_000403 [Botryotinia globosa]
MHFYLFLTTMLAILPEFPGAKCLSTSMCPFQTGTATRNTSTHSVIVGAAGRLAFNPSRINVALGDKVLFEFLALNHTLTQSSLQNPCTWNASGGIDTGFKQFNPSNTSSKFVVEYTVESSVPLWFFCSQKRPISQCHGFKYQSIRILDWLCCEQCFALAKFEDFMQLLHTVV